MLVQLFKEDLLLEHQLSTFLTCCLVFSSCLRLVQLFKEDLLLKHQLSPFLTCFLVFSSCLRLVQLFKEDLLLEHQLSCARRVFFMEAGDLMHEFCTQVERQKAFLNFNYFNERIIFMLSVAGRSDP